MPGKLVVVLALLSLNLLLSAGNVALEGVGLNVVGLAINAFLIYGVVRGNESIRKILIGLSWLGLIFSGLGLVLLVPLMAVSLGTVGGMVALATLAIGVVRCGYTIWALNQGDVQSWMFKKSLGAAAL